MRFWVSWIPGSLFRAVTINLISRIRLLCHPMSSELSGPHAADTIAQQNNLHGFTDKKDIIHFLHGTTKEHLNGRGDVTVTLYRQGSAGPKSNVTKCNQ